MDAASAESQLAHAQRAIPGLRGLDGRAIAKDLDTRYGDLTEALGWFIAQGRSDDALRFASTLAPFWMTTKRLAEGCDWCERAIALPGGSEAVRAEALFQQGLLWFWRGDDDRATAVLERSLAIGRRTADPSATAKALSGLARVALRRSGVDDARKLLHEGLALTEGGGDRLARGNILHVLGVAAQMAGDLEEARGYMTERIAIAREMKIFSTVGMEGSNLAMVERQLGNLDEAEELSREALDISVRRGDAWMTPLVLSGLAAVAALKGRHERAATIIGAVEAMMQAQGFEWPPDERPHYETTVAALKKAMRADELERARATGREMSEAEIVDWAMRPSVGG